MDFWIVVGVLGNLVMAGSTRCTGEPFGDIVTALGAAIRQGYGVHTGARGGSSYLVLNAMLSTAAATVVLLQVVVFPAWVPHEIEPTPGTEPRLSVVFNIPGKWTDFAGSHFSQVLSVDQT